MRYFLDLVREASELCDEEYDNALWVDWFNSALDDLAEVLFMSKRATISAANGLFPVPEDLKSVIRIDGITKNLRNLEADDDTSLGYKILGTNFEIQGEFPETIGIVYYRYPAHISLSDVGVPLDINDRFAKGVVLYSCAQAMLREDESERYELFWGQYIQFKTTVRELMRKQMPGTCGTIKVVR